tara:strand:- start:1154 stop:1495 length:342 start_codon:yes stop_codon:yes gene_type:complete
MELNANDCTPNDKKRVLHIINAHNMPYNLMEKELQVSSKGVISSWNQVYRIVAARRTPTKRRRTQSMSSLKSIGNMTIKELENVILKQQDELSKVDLIKQIQANAQLLVEKRA